MSAFKLDSRVMGGALESTPGTAETLVAGDFDVRIKDLSVSEEIEEYGRKYSRGHHGADASVMGKQTGTLSFSVDVAGSGTAGTAPAWAKYLKACGYSETIVAVTSVTYAPDAAADCTPITLELRDFYCDSTPAQHVTKLAGAMGSVNVVTDNVGAPMRLEFEFKGKLVSEADATGAGIFTVSGTDTTAPPAVLSATITNAGIAQRLDTFTLTGGEDIQILTDPADSTGWLHAMVNTREATFQGDPELRKVADEAVYTNWRDGVLTALSVVVGADAGNIVTIAAPKAQIITSSRGNRNGAITRELQSKLVATSGNDEFTIALT